MAVQRGRVMTVAKWAVELGCTEETLRKAIRRKQLLAVRKPLVRGMPYEINAIDMDAFLLKRRSQ
jgi:predicted transcriptional regulator